MTAEDYAKQATITWDEWVHRVQTNPAYPVKSTKWYAAGVELEKVRETPPPPPPGPDPLAPYRSIIFAAQNPLDALQAPAYYKVAFTADPAYDSYATKGAADSLRAAGHEVYVWYVPTEVSKARADEVAQRLGTKFVLGQCETEVQFTASWNRDGRLAMVGNLSALSDSQLHLVSVGGAIVVNELYRNCQPGQQPDWKNANRGVPGNCVATYRDSQCSRMPLSQYVADGMFVPHRDSVYGPGMEAEDWKTLRDLG